MEAFGVVSFGVAALTYAAMTAVLSASHPGGRCATWITVATATSTVWAGGMVLLLLLRPVPLAVVVGLDSLHACIWIACILSWLAPPSNGYRLPTGALLLALSGLFAVWTVVASIFTVPSLPAEAEAADFIVAPGTSAAYQGVWLAALGVALVGLLAVEQVFRNAREEQRSGLRLLCLGVGAIFMMNVFVYSQASLLGELIPLFWEGRGLVNVAAAPLMLIALKRQRSWERELFVSRQFAFYSASLAAVGGYLMVMGAIAYVIRAMGGQWGLLLELAFLAAAAAILVYVLFSSSIRARAKVFLVKHFYRNKYDHRREWLQLTSALSRTGDSRELAASALQGIARIVSSEAGALWLATDGGVYEEVAVFGDADISGAMYDEHHPVVNFLRTHGWVIDSDEYRREPDRYGSAFGDPKAGLLAQDALIVPLDCQGFLQGFVILARPPGVGSLNFEDHDILKTAGRQIAVVLAQALAQEQLTATRQFEAVNKLATFLMHDLKNIVTQQELVVANAQRFGHRADFVEDAIATVRSGAERMRKVLDQLRSAAHSPPSQSRADLSKTLLEVASHCSDRAPIPQFEQMARPLWVAMNREQLASVLTHVIRNAQEATPADGQVSVTVRCEAGCVVISVTDTGEGMDRAFIRDRLFRPFDSTKGVRGMGIGAYQVRETVRNAGGDVEVTSRPGSGTTFRIRLPTLERLAFTQPAA